MATREPRSMPEARSASCSASVPLAHVTTCGVPNFVPSAASRRCVVGPPPRNSNVSVKCGTTLFKNLLPSPSSCASTLVTHGPRSTNGTRSATAPSLLVLRVWIVDGQEVLQLVVELRRSSGVEILLLVRSAHASLDLAAHEREQSPRGAFDRRRRGLVLAS